MGLYIETSSEINKARELMMLHGATIWPHRFLHWSEVPMGKLPVVVVHNGSFEAAGVAFSPRELVAFTLPDDNRGKTILLMDQAKVFKLCPFVEEAISEMQERGQYEI